MGNFAVADLHSCYKQWRQIQSFCKDSDRIFVLGDCIDRGIESLDTLKSVMRDPRTTLLCGNHEDMMRQTLVDYFDGECEYGYPWFWNDGYGTFQQWIDDGYKRDWIPTLQHLPLWAKYTNEEGVDIIMTHSGAVGKHGYPIDSCGRKALLWDRKHLNEKKWHRGVNEIIVHGHTTSIHLLENLNILKETDILNPLIVKYCQGHKIDIDLCSCSTGICALLDLESLQPIYFNTEGKINETRSLEVDSRV